MAKPKSPLLSLGAHGTIADTLTYQKRHRVSIARVKPIPTDPKSPAQLAQRQLYSDAVDAWNALSPEEKEAWRGVCPGLTAYQCFMKTELKYIPPPVPIDIGSEAIDRPTFTSFGRTYIALDNPANASGIIDTIRVWAQTDMKGLLVATFYLLSGDTYKCRSHADIGAVTSGSLQIFTGLSIAVEAGDHIGFFTPVGSLERSSFGYPGLYWKSDDWITGHPFTEYTFVSGDTFSLYGTGEQAS